MSLTFCSQYYPREARPVSVSVFYSHFRTVPSRVILYSVATGSAWDCPSGLALASLVASAWWTVVQSLHTSLQKSRFRGDCPHTTFHLFAMPHSGADFHPLLRSLTVVIFVYFVTVGPVSRPHCLRKLIFILGAHSICLA